MFLKYHTLVLPSNINSMAACVTAISMGGHPHVSGERLGTQYLHKIYLTERALESSPTKNITEVQVLDHQWPHTS